MRSGWRDISKIIGVILALSLIAYNLYVGTDILKALFRGVSAYLIFAIANILFTSIIYRIVSEFEQKRLEELNQLEGDLSFDDDEDDLIEPTVAEGHPE
ncbi:hypothetical protein BMS3Bbin04_01312 [bacterium BMS3Bbin04]|nr:hypothetical protein BMS3Bbin04_01312 [bacterium BMS3Bbin04]